MTRSATTPPRFDPTSILEIFRGNHATELLTAAVSHFNVFGCLTNRRLGLEELRKELNLEERPATVLITALRAFGLIDRDGQGRLFLTELAQDHLVPGGNYDLGGYIGLAAESPGVVEMVERLRTNRPAGEKPDEKGAAFIYREGIESAMENEANARQLTLALAGRAKNVAPILAERYSLEGRKCLLDVGGGTGIYSIAWLQRHPNLRAIVWDRPEVLKVAQEMAQEYGVADRLEVRPGDMFTAPVPTDADAILLSNILHDWDVPECRTLIRRLADVLPTGGKLLIHDVFLNDELDGPLATALYSAALFRLTEGRAYSAGEYRQWLKDAGLSPGEITPTLIHCGVLPGIK
ncbi:methyltransferase [Singulisphaera sp. PoT]|uniref:methyltransferase n=1 Tax=Singulisphaera sp. PoT TaxID=3411797 RepID=UPI003BF51DBE